MADWGFPIRRSRPAVGYAAALLGPLRNIGLRIIIEPGRVLVGNAGIFVTRVLYVKETDVKRFVVVDGAMNDLIGRCSTRPITRFSRWSGVHRPTIVGPLTWSVRYARAAISFARERELPEVESGDLLAVMSAGAYGFVMASNYNSRPRAAEVLINGAEVHVIRERDNFEDIIRNEKIVTLKGGPDA